MALYPYQEKVKALIQSGKSVILQAPTGAGKTRAALSPFIECFFDRPVDAFPRKCIYSVPMRVLAHQFTAEFKGLSDSYQRRFHRKLRVSIQTGDQPDDRRFDEGDLIFCTIDQSLSSYLTMPYSLPHRLANLNAGALVGSYLVFDEFHLLDPDSTLPSVLYALGQLARLAPVLLMTATFSAQMLDALAQFIGAEVVLVSQEEAHQIETRQGQTEPRRRVWRTAEGGLTADAVLAVHGSRSLALCNTVQRAQRLYRDLCKQIELSGLNTRVLLLHSRFLPEDRRLTEAALQEWFGKDTKRSGSIIAVATQTIEVGVDITCERLHTELAPASALIQRAGRCARFPGEQGEVLVYPVESFAPYGKEASNPEKDCLWVREMKATFEWLKSHSGGTFDFAAEQALVNAVATPRDRAILASIGSTRMLRAGDINRVLTGERRGDDTRLLVRDAQSCRVLVHDDPDQLLKNPYAATGFSLQPMTLYGMVKSWLERDVDVDWRVKYLQTGPADVQESNRSEYGWLNLHDPALLPGKQVVVVHPDLAGYSRDEGFIADYGNTGFVSALPADAVQRTWEGFSYRLESYEEHVQHVLEAFSEQVLPGLQYPARALEQAAGWAPDSFLHAAWLVCLLHDTGKLNENWQGWARYYQRLIGKPVKADFAAAHTDMEWGNSFHREAEKKARAKWSKPNHAGEGALASSAILNRALGNKDLTMAALTAITRHHTPFAGECNRFSLVPCAQEHVQATLAYLPIEVNSKVAINLLVSETRVIPISFPSLLTSPSDTFGWLAYTLLARALRLADQAGTARGSKEKEV